MNREDDGAPEDEDSGDELIGGGGGPDPRRNRDPVDLAHGVVIHGGDRETVVRAVEPYLCIPSVPPA